MKKKLIVPMILLCGTLGIYGKVYAETGVVESIYTTADIPDKLMNDEFKKVIELFSKGFSQSGLDIADAEKTDSETFIFYFEGLEFLGNELEEGSRFCLRVIYNQDAISNNGIPNKMLFRFSNSLKSNGYTETVEMVEDIAAALDISDSGLIDNDYSSSSKLAIGDYATFILPNLNLKLTVSNTDDSIEIEMVPIEELIICDDAETIKRVQELLNNAGYECGVADGIAGEKTIDAIKQYQSEHDLNVNGIITDTLLAELEQ